MYPLTIWLLIAQIPCAFAATGVLLFIFRNKKTFGAVFSTALLFQYIFYFAVRLLTMDRPHCSIFLHLLTSTGLNVLGSGLILLLTMLIDENISYK